MWLVGMMGAGKSTLGPVIAARLRRRFVDTDHEIERIADCSIPEIFESEGERGFRVREEEVILALEGSGAVVALGGGAIGDPRLRERLLQSGTVVYLEASPETLVERVGDAANRPLLQGQDREERLTTISELLEAREASLPAGSCDTTDGNLGCGGAGGTIRIAARRNRKTDGEG